MICNIVPTDFGRGIPGVCREQHRIPIAYRPLVELVALFALMPKYTGRTIDFSQLRVRILRDHFSTQGRLA